MNQRQIDLGTASQPITQHCDALMELLPIRKIFDDLPTDYTGFIVEPREQADPLHLPDFVWAALAGRDPRRRNFQNRSFAYANLSGANLSGANLSGANLSGAKLKGANLEGAIGFGPRRSLSNCSLVSRTSAKSRA